MHNALPYLEAALASVRNQTLRDFEALCLDDGSTDGSAAVLDRTAEADPRFRVLRPGRVGLIEACNRLFRTARASYVARFDADDAMSPRRLEEQAAFLDAHPDVDIVSCLVRHFPAAEVRGGNRAYEAWLNGLVTHEEIVREIFVESPLAHPSVMTRKDVVARLGGYRDMRWPEDYDLWLRAREQGLRVGKVARVLHLWRDHPSRETRRHPRYSLESFLRAKAHFLLRGPLAGGHSFLVWGAGMMGRRLTRLLVRAGRPPLALLDIDPCKIGRSRQGRPILPPEAIRPQGVRILAAVGARGARALIRGRLLGWGLTEGADFWMVA